MKRVIQTNEAPEIGKLVQRSDNWIIYKIVAEEKHTFDIIPAYFFGLDDGDESYTIPKADFDISNSPIAYYFTVKVIEE